MKSRTTPRLPSANVQRLVTVGVLLAAVGALVLAAAYQSDDQPDNEAAITGGGLVPEGSATEPTIPISPIERWLPATGEGTTCREPVGVDLIPGYEAILTINGQRIDVEDMNAPGSAGRSLGQFTWGPEDGCPRSGLLRPENNTVEACVYLITDGPDSCITSVTTFNAL